MAATTVDLRSDTLTVPGPAMRAAMAAAEVGDDVWGEDPTVRRLEARVCELLGKEAAVFVPSGTMGNLASIAAQVSPGDEVVADVQAHVVWYEVGGVAAIAGAQLKTLDGKDGLPDAALLRGAVRQRDIHAPVTRLLCVENTHNRRGGAALAPERIDACTRLAHELGLRVHCDGARLFNAAVALGCGPARLVAGCDSVSVCLSKGLGAPVGSVIAGDADFVAAARRWRKRLGGGMRQAGVIAAGGLYALEHNVARLAEDHVNAALIASRLRDAGVALLEPEVATNIVVLEIRGEAAGAAASAAERGVLVAAMGPHLLRCVTHLNLTTDDCRRAADVLVEIVCGAQSGL